MVGVDLVVIARIERLLEKYGVSFLQNFLHKSEIDLCIKNAQCGESSEFLGSQKMDISHFNVERIAGFYAAKEAISKALGCGISKNLTFKDIKLNKDSRGVPKAKLKKRTKKHFNIKKIHLSITHDKVCIKGDKSDLQSPHRLEHKGFAVAIALIK